MRRVTSPSLLQLAKVNTTLPAPQKLVDISSLVHPRAIQVFSLIRLNFRSHVSPGSTKRCVSSILFVSQPPSLMFPKELRSLIPWFAQAAEGPVKTIKYLIITDYNSRVCINIHTSLFKQQSITRILGWLRVVAEQVLPLGEGVVAVHCLLLLSSTLGRLYESGTSRVIGTSKLCRDKHLESFSASRKAGLFRNRFIEILSNCKVQKQNIKM